MDDFSDVFSWGAGERFKILREWEIIGFEVEKLKYEMNNK